MTAHAIDTVTLDLDDTLLEYERTTEEVLAVAFERADVDPLFEAAEYYARYDEFLAESDSIDDLRTNCFGVLAEEGGYDPELGRTVAMEYNAERDQSRVQFLPGAREALDALAAHHELAIVTNGAPDMQQAKLASLGIDEWVDTVVFAGHDTLPKPDPAPFHHALDLLDAAPERTLHVGNSLTTDIPGAKAAGLHAAWVPADPELTPDPEPDYSFRTLAELLDLPWRRD